MQPNTNRFTKIGANGEVLPREATAWEAVLDNTTGLMWAVKAVKVSSQKKAEAAAKSCTAAGFTDWDLSEVEPLFALADRSKVNPAIDTEFFPDCPSDWFWTKTLDAESPSDDAWYVYFYSGYSSRSSRSYSGWVRGVRVGQ